MRRRKLCEENVIKDEGNNPFLSPKRKTLDDRYIPPLIPNDQKLKYAQDCKNVNEDGSSVLEISTPKLLFATPSSSIKTPSKRTERDAKEWERLMASPSLFYASRDIKKQVKRRGISKTPDLVLDAPNALDDFYTRLIDWSCTGNMLVALAEDCYVWNKVKVV
jgi:hypothetical protein